jgi:hypothetical protein
MTNQTLGDDQIVNVRWAMEDPNPRAIEEAQVTFFTRPTIYL